MTTRIDKKSLRECVKEWQAKYFSSATKLSQSVVRPICESPSKERKKKIQDVYSFLILLLSEHGDVQRFICKELFSDLCFKDSIVFANGMQEAIEISDEILKELLNKPFSRLQKRHLINSLMRCQYDTRLKLMNCHQSTLWASCVRINVQISHHDVQMLINSYNELKSAEENMKFNYPFYKNTENH